MIKERAAKKKVVLELGGNAACIIEPDSGLDVDTIVSRLLFGAFFYAGQSCISVQVTFNFYSGLFLLKKKYQLSINQRGFWFTNNFTMKFVKNWWQVPKTGTQRKETQEAALHSLVLLFLRMMLKELNSG